MLYLNNLILQPFRSENHFNSQKISLNNFYTLLLLFVALNNTEK